MLINNDLINVTATNFSAPSPKVCALRPGRSDSTHSSLGLIGGNLRHVCFLLKSGTFSGAYICSECSQKLTDLHAGHHRRSNNGCSSPILAIQAPRPNPRPQSLRHAPRSWFENGPQRGRERGHR
ncbi:hypothetical protein K443DRAFT_276429 [Laccaria amethystina LaAM-08-1]|uniref:Uncharacterized protein n=1 Tax=Laccaria amethystina LaAM-08-1 TaxID=1095629 RepID=A0A0C9X5U2_9AGAR|nr:hypothetical protein K443DRAFT_276429 [Laccaria amethystina LaAM-08-1]